jgi:hypothetical protein
MVDPSVYEDLKMLLGNVQRNQALRALVRYSIQRDDGPAGVEVVDPEAAEKKDVAATPVTRSTKAASAKGDTTVSTQSRATKAAQR